ncbi:serine--tRNA ligase [Candidatus Gottesmanbacteria bacterium RIFCSPLOWO2_02_FULL_42_29]|uniref:Serine--tRNA ligase n=2 Tax=Candidatus Gottesmaniibacteriota TaxID=1752720 RepID=A0A1F6BCE0_9BACT|nr:MAG: Serine-tRNA ligase [Candidatus Gottesmanbacteria bacterium GW2011_GWA2_42_18]OGG11114.1 MAG: serine--tRNA ligase [Candidatus Gottesmanbacteria bacterium RIFCSPHIGHO2_01_FULL_42_27]OGG20669.1 MAG: serine--tRNA ligase [Candidatus Gottesmanbacteria bacterium RIFCSPHIGHO2_12_FULL_43_26]OGG33923.1 MAG: serine--tRNA ligase [Candidatus Gottesmanbacteria bacterium RIFCSPLOWO2_12_FULL_42_10]OGG34538.1 MAG: serine--tRNA ligase [Candidatus Gottesmanbacteria bacterium RIFCSPLOWO2_01_FULL_42_22]OGG
MFDIKFIRENPKIVKEAAKNKNRKVDIDRLLKVDEERRRLIGESENLRAERNKLAKEAQKDAAAREKGRALKEKIAKIDETLKKAEEEFKQLMYQVPSVPDESVPIGPDASFNIEVKKWGDVPEFTYTPRDHIQLGLQHDLFDIERGAKVAGFRGYFLKNEAALMEMAILSYTYKKLVTKGYIPLIAPSLTKEFTFYGVGQFPWGREEVYHLEKDSLYLSGTAEVPVTSYFAGEVLNEADLPKKFVAFSPCFRREAGSYGKDTKGLYRLHQFNKVEQVIISKNDYQGSLKLHEELLHNSEEVLQDLKLPYRVMLMSTGDMGEPQVKKYDIETWMPSRKAYGETMSNSFMGDFQTRRLNIRYRNKKGEIEYTHSLNNTAIASPRILIAILENYQQEDGSIAVPDILQDYVGKKIING